MLYLSMNKICEVCGITFDAWNKTKATCSKECQLKFHRLIMARRMREKRAKENTIIEKTCIQCGQKFKIHITDNDVCCLNCKILNSQILPKREYDLTNTDSEGIIYGTIAKPKV